MSDTVCMVCTHGPHAAGPCIKCGCTQWVNSQAQSARSLTALTNMCAEVFPVLERLLADMLAVLAEVHPEAVARIDEKREAAYAAQQAARQQESEQAASQQFGDQADQEGQNAGSGGGDGTPDSRNEPED